MDSPVMVRIYGSLATNITSQECGSIGSGGSVRKFLTISDLSNSTISICCFFQEVDRKLDSFKPGDLVLVTGVKRCQAGDPVQAVKVELFNPDEVLPYIGRLEHFARIAINEKQEV